MNVYSSSGSGRNFSVSLLDPCNLFFDRQEFTFPEREPPESRLEQMDVHPGIGGLRHGTFQQSGGKPEIAALMKGAVAMQDIGQVVAEQHFRIGFH